MDPKELNNHINRVINACDRIRALRAKHNRTNELVIFCMLSGSFGLLTGFVLGIGTHILK